MLLTAEVAVALPDFSRAGCEVDLEQHVSKTTVNIVDFGAVPDDDIGDSAAINAAIQLISTTGGTVQIPEGRWILDAIVELRSNNVRLSGDENGGTILYCPKSLADLYGEKREWSWSGGFLRLQPNGSANVLGTIQSTATSGSTELDIQWKGDVPKVGAWIQIWWYNDKGEDTLFKWLYGDAIPRAKYGNELRNSDSSRVRSWFKIVAVDSKSITIDPPLPMPVSPAWNPTVMSVPHLMHCVIENLTFDFVKSTYPGHLKERGHNAIVTSSLVESVIQNLRIINADSGIIMGNAGFTTICNVDIQGRTMHHPISLSWCSHCLVEEFEIDAPHIHGTTISWSSHFNVFNKGRGNELSMDSHRACSFRNLHQNIKIEHGLKPKQPLRSGGAYARGLHSARENVYWNIEHRFPTEGPPFHVKYLDEWPLGVFVGWYGNREIVILPVLDGQIVEGINEKPRELFH